MKFLDALNRDLKRFGKLLHVCKTFRLKLFLQLVSSELVYCRAKVLRILADRIDHPRKHEGELNLLTGRRAGISFFWLQNFSAHSNIVRWEFHNLKP